MTLRFHRWTEEVDMGKIDLPFSRDLDMEGVSPAGTAVRIDVSWVYAEGAGVGARETLIGCAEPARLEWIEAGRGGC